MICPYCGANARLVTGDVVYPHRRDLYSKRFFYCDNKHDAAYVGTHGNGTAPLGTLANAELRSARSAAHAAFDPHWRSGKMTRSAAYKWLSDVMETSKNNTHIGMFNLAQCERVVKVFKEVLTMDEG